MPDSDPGSRPCSIITLVTEPAAFDQELAAAQTVIDTIVQSEEPPLDPLAAYGGWLAAAQERPSIAGPLSGELAFGPGALGVERAGVDAPDFYARAEFANPEPAREMWDIGLGFRDSGGEEQLRLVVDAEGTWFLKDGLGAVITGGSVVDFDASPDGSNIIEVVAAGDTGYFAFNERLVGELDLSARAEGGDVFVGAGFFTEDATEDGTDRVQRVRDLVAGRARPSGGARAEHRHRRGHFPAARRGGDRRSAAGGSHVGRARAGGRLGDGHADWRRRRGFRGAGRVHQSQRRRPIGRGTSASPSANRRTATTTG